MVHKRTFGAGRLNVRLRAESSPNRKECGHRAAFWLPDFQDEITKFPAGKHDDQVDSLSQFLKWATRSRSRVELRSL